MPWRRSRLDMDSVLCYIHDIYKKHRASSIFDFVSLVIKLYQKRTASGQILRPPLEVQISCSRTLVPGLAALTILPAREKMPTCATLFLQSPLVAQKSMSPGLALLRAICLPILEWYWVEAVRAVRPLAADDCPDEGGEWLLTDCLALSLADGKLSETFEILAF